MAAQIKSANRRESFLAYYGPLSLFPLLGFWALGLILGFACVQYGLGEHLTLGNERINFWKVVYLSGETFFTLGYGDITPSNSAARALAVMGEAHGLRVSWSRHRICLPVIYNSFCRAARFEISLLDARAGSPPSAGPSFRTLWGCCPDQTVLDEIFRDWERWCADLLSSHISYPVLLFFRSQHPNQSWLGAVTAMLDVTSLIISGVDGIHPDQAKLTFAMARHAVVDLSQVVNAEYSPHDTARLTAEDQTRLRILELAQHGVTLAATRSDGTDAAEKLACICGFFMNLIFTPLAGGF